MSGRLSLSLMEYVLIGSAFESKFFSSCSAFFWDPGFFDIKVLDISLTTVCERKPGTFLVRAVLCAFCGDYPPAIPTPDSIEVLLRCMRYVKAGGILPILLGLSRVIDLLKPPTDPRTIVENVGPFATVMLSARLLKLFMEVLSLVILFF